MTDLIERLNATECSKPDFGVHTNWYRNPDGPEAAKVITQAQAEIARLREELSLWRMLVNEGGVPRYTVTPGAALNTVVTSTDALLRQAALKDTTQ